MKNHPSLRGKRLIAMIAGLGLITPLAACGQTDTGANAVSQPQAYSIAAKTLPDHIVNGDFEYPSIAGHATDKIMDGYAWWAYILPDEGASQTDQRKAPKTITEFDANRSGGKALRPPSTGSTRAPSNSRGTSKATRLACSSRKSSANSANTPSIRM